ncbi:acyl-CoA synthetase [Sphingobium sp. SCG-1]|uniref:acyl-CoA synthetase n=1 Tax=Sphingobium sp. SCG-1 TaxID=2072936 RepID=UPI000CD67FB7|nr:acyl-CoA synthetase [Sphingobium sp. SCG-1]AUW59306.1 acyl-CoA synthetase [Sphingobium sp. SCG-1]
MAAVDRKVGIRTINDVLAIEAVPIGQRMPFRTTWDVFEYAARTYGDMPALSFLMFGSADEEPVRWSFRELLQDLTRSANALHALGVSEDAPVSVVLPNLPETHFALWGGERAGITNMVNPLLEPDHMGAIIDAAGSETVITLAPSMGMEIFQTVTAALNHAPRVRTVVTVDPTVYLPEQMRVAIAAQCVQPGLLRAEIALHDFRTLLAGAEADRLTFDRPIGPETIASLFHTGGTTGLPKLARHSHLNEAFEAWIVPLGSGAEPGRTLLCGLPLFHVNGVTVTGLGAWSSGGHVLLATPQGYRNPTLTSQFWRVIERHQVNVFSGVPTLYARLLDQPIDADISSLEFAYCGAAPMPPELIRRFETATGAKIVEGYGLTEGGCVSSSNPAHGERKAGSVGFRLPYQELRIVDLTADGGIGAEKPIGEAGAVVIRGPNVFPGYTDATKNKGVLLADGWLATGDLGRLDSDGYLWLTGRAKDLIIRGGHNIDPAVIEDALAAHPAVALAAAIGSPDPYTGEMPVAFVSLRSGQEIDGEALRAFAAERISERAAVPSHVTVLDEMPVTAVGKTFKPPLRILAAESALRRHLAEAGIAETDVVGIQDPDRGLVVTLSVPESATKQAAALAARFALQIDVVNK